MALFRPQNCGAVAPTLLAIGRAQGSSELLRLHNGFCLQNDRSTTNAGRAADRKLARLRRRSAHLIRARTSEGRERAKARGVKMGRPPKLTPHQRKEAIKRRDQGNETLADIGRSYHVSAATISRLTPCL
jgi:DNA invertase Pin-like site-specific DNA recombinase